MHVHAAFVRWQKGRGARSGSGGVPAALKHRLPELVRQHCRSNGVVGNENTGSWWFVSGNGMGWQSNALPSYVKLKKPNCTHPALSLQTCGRVEKHNAHEWGSMRQVVRCALHRVRVGSINGITHVA